MEKTEDNDLIPVWLWLKPIDKNIITTAMTKEKGMNPDIYDNEEPFYAEIVSETPCNFPFVGI